MHLSFYASVRMDIRRVSQIKQGDEIIGNHCRVKVVKKKSPHLLGKQSLISCTIKELVDQGCFGFSGR